MGNIFDKAIEVAQKGRKFIVVTHVNPEGDALGSLFGLGLALKGLGKEVVIYLEEPVPEPFGFMAGSELAVYSLEGVADVDATFAVDCGQLERLGDGFVEFKGRGTLVNMDHHPTNNNFGDINIVVPEASAAGEIVYDFLKEAGIDITGGVATNLYVAIHTDTGSFRYSSASAAAFKKAGELVTLGADPWQVSALVYENYPEARFRLLAKVLDTLEISSDGTIATVVVTRRMLEGVGGNDNKGLSDGFVNYARAIKGVDVGALFRECEPGESEVYKISLRSKSGIDVACVAESFGGGGHVHAAGATMKGTLDEVKKKVLDALREKACVVKKAEASGS